MNTGILLGRTRPFGALIALVSVSALSLGSAVCAAEIATDWQDGFNFRTRLSAGSVADAGGEKKFYAFFEIEMPEGWKTYWKNPGESGVPPVFDWSTSRNVTGARVLYPAPYFLADKGGPVNGYTEHAVFPVEIDRTDASAPTLLNVTVQFGVCKDICVPAEATASLTVEPGEAEEPAYALLMALDRVPRRGNAIRPTDPVLSSSQATLAGAKPRLVFVGRFPGGGEVAELFLAPPDGVYLPPAQRTSDSGEEVTFEVDLSSDVDLDALRGAVVSATLVSDKGQSEFDVKLVESSNP